MGACYLSKPFIPFDQYSELWNRAHSHISCGRQYDQKGEPFRNDGTVTKRIEVGIFKKVKRNEDFEILLVIKTISNGKFRFFDAYKRDFDKVSVLVSSALSKYLENGAARFACNYLCKHDSTSLVDRIGNPETKSDNYHSTIRIYFDQVSDACCTWLKNITHLSTHR